MARRNLVNVAERILLETIKTAAAESIEKTPSKKIAEKCDITDATVFVYFKTKKNLFKKAYEYSLEKLNANFKSNANLLQEGKYREFWDEILSYAIENDYFAKYCAAYRHSVYADITNPYAAADFIKDNFNAELIRGLTSEQYYSLLDTVFSIFLETVTAFADKKIERNKKTLDAFLTYAWAHFCKKGIKVIRSFSWNPAI